MIHIHATPTPHDKNTDILSLLRKREQRKSFSPAVKKQISISCDVRKYKKMFRLLFYHPDEQVKISMIARFIKSRPESTDAFLALLEELPHSPTCKIRLFRTIIANHGTLKHQHILRKIIESRGFDVNALYHVPMPVPRDDVIIKKGFLHYAAKMCDMPLMQLLNEYNVDVTLKSSEEKTALDYYNEEVRLMNNLKISQDPVTHQEILRLLTPKT